MSSHYSSGRHVDAGYDDGAGGVNAYPDNRYPSNVAEGGGGAALSRSQEYFPDDYGEYDDDHDRRRRPLTAEEVEFERQKRLDHFEMIDGTRQCMVTAWSIFVTCVLVGDLVTDAWLMILYGIQGHNLFLGLSIIFYVVTSFTIAAMYAIQLPGGGTKNADDEIAHKRAAKSVRLMAGCWLCNVPLQLGVIVHRIVYAFRRCGHCCESENRRGPARTEWTLAKLKLVHSTMQSAPMLTTNLLHILVFPNLHWMQWISACFSFSSVIIGVSTFENCRKSRAKSSPVSASQSALVFLYKSCAVSARIAAIANFTYYYGPAVLFLLLPHYCLLFVAFTLVYSKMYRVSYAKIGAHCYYCLIDYIPLLNDYRPEGEIILFYVAIVFENLIMVVLPMKIRPTQNININAHSPNTVYYKLLLSLVIIGSLVSIVLATLYYLFFHRSRHNIRKSYLGFIIGKICPCLYGVCTGENRRSREVRTPASGVHQQVTSNEYAPSKQEMSQQTALEYSRDQDVTQVNVAPLQSDPQQSDPHYYPTEMYSDKYNSPYCSTTQPLNSAPQAPVAQQPSRAPSQAPSRVPSQAQSRAPSQAQSRAPSQAHSRAPSQAPSRAPSRAVSQAPSAYQPTPAPRSTSASNDDVFTDSKQRY